MKCLLLHMAFLTNKREYHFIFYFCYLFFVHTYTLSLLFSDSLGVFFLFYFFLVLIYDIHNRKPSFTHFFSNYFWCIFLWCCFSCISWVCVCVYALAGHTGLWFVCVFVSCSFYFLQLFACVSVCLKINFLTTT